jgi:hypothetical protein
VAVEPWEIGAAWAYELDWQPLPVFQNYSAYTSSLDRLNAETIEAPDGPERILRDDTEVVVPEFPGPDLDGRYPGWDPPEQQRAILCNFAPLYTDELWQVLGRVPDRCGAPREVGSVSAEAGAAVQVPSPGPGEVVFVRIGGAGVSGLERLQTFLFHAGSRHVVVNGPGWSNRARSPLSRKRRRSRSKAAPTSSPTTSTRCASVPPPQRRDRQADRELGADPQVDGEVQQRVRGRRVEASVEAAHATVEGDLLLRGTAPGA